MPVKSKTNDYLTVVVPRGEMKKIEAAAKKAERPKGNWAWLIIKRELDKETRK